MRGGDALIGCCRALPLQYLQNAFVINEFTARELLAKPLETPSWRLRKEEFRCHCPQSSTIGYLLYQLVIVFLGGASVPLFEAEFVCCSEVAEAKP